MTDDKLYTSLSANTIMAILSNHVQRTRLIRSSTDKHYSLDSEDDFRSGCRNVSHQQQFFSEIHSPGRSHYTNYSIFSHIGDQGVAKETLLKLNTQQLEIAMWCKRDGSGFLCNCKRLQNLKLTCSFSMYYDCFELKQPDYNPISTCT